MWGILYLTTVGLLPQIGTYYSVEPGTFDGIEENPIPFKTDLERWELFEILQEYRFELYDDFEEMYMMLDSFLPYPLGVFFNDPDECDFRDDLDPYTFYSTELLCDD